MGDKNKNLKEELESSLYAAGITKSGMVAEIATEFFFENVTPETFKRLKEANGCSN